MWFVTGSVLCYRDSHNHNTSYCGFVRIDNSEQAAQVNEQESAIPGKASTVDLLMYLHLCTVACAPAKPWLLVF